VDAGGGSGPPHIRRTYASDLINRGVPLEHVSKMLGHVAQKYKAAVGRLLHIPHI
jgi:site-specific recombinase XerD